MTKPRLSAAQPIVLAGPNEYRWIDGPDPKNPNRAARWLVTGRGLSPDYHYRWDAPDIAELFLEFALLDHSEEAILEFVDRYGDLGERIPWPEKRAPIHSGELLSQWIAEIRAMRAAVDLSRAVADGDTSQLRKWIDYGENGSVHLVRTEPEAKGKWPGRSQLPIDRRPVAAAHVLASMINIRLRESTSTEVRLDGTSGRLVMDSAPTSLRTAMWLQFAECVSLGKVASCRSCGKLMRLVPGIARSDKKVCSSRCRVNYSRELKRKKQTKRRTPQ